MHLHLPDNSGVTLRMLALVIRDIVADIIVDRALAEAEEEAEDAELEQARAEGAVIETAAVAPCGGRGGAGRPARRAG